MDGREGRGMGGKKGKDEKEGRKGRDLGERRTENRKDRK
jgi:hypothetical protein